MFYENDIIRTSNKVSAKDRDTLRAHGIKPGTIGKVISEQTYVTVSFNGT